MKNIKNMKNKKITWEFENEELDTSFQDFFLQFKEEFKCVFIPEIWYDFNVYADTIDLWIVEKDNYETQIIESSIDRWMKQRISEIEDNTEGEYRIAIENEFNALLENKDRILSLYFKVFKNLPEYIASFLIV